MDVSLDPDDLKPDRASEPGRVFSDQRGQMMPAQNSNLPMSVVIIDDNQQHLSLMELSIEKAFETDQCQIVTSTHLTPAEGLAELVDHTNQIILIDYQLSGSTGVDWLADFVRAGAGPVILITSSGGEQIATEAFRAGAADYIIKSDAFLNPTILCRSIKESLRKYRLELTNRDLTKRLKEANKDLNSKNRKLTELTETAHRFVEDVAHEFRTPLTVIKEFASILADGLGGEVNPKQVQYLNYITSSTGDLAGLIDDFLNSSRMRSNTICVSRSEFTVRELIEGVCPMLQSRAASKSISLEFEFDDDLPKVYADADKVHRSIINLVVNAIKFSDQGATVNVSAALDHEHAVQISVRDNGPGLPDEAVNELFERFNRGSAGNNRLANGFGLGLSIVKGLVELNLGSVTLQSTLGEGSVFAFTIPCATQEGIVRGLIAQGKKQTRRMQLAMLHVQRANQDQPIEQLAPQLDQMSYPLDLVIESTASNGVVLLGITDDEHALQVRISEAFAEADDQALSPVMIQCCGVWELELALEPVLELVASTTPMEITHA